MKLHKVILKVKDIDELAPPVLHKRQYIFDKSCCFPMTSLLGKELFYYFIMRNEHITSIVMALMGILSFR